jgi:guanylate kinase
MSGLAFIITAPSGAGKTSLVAELLRREPDLRLSVSYTTRPPRVNEQDGVNYHFVTRAAFEAMIVAGDFLEHAQVFGHYYGTSRSWVDAELAAGRDVLLEIDCQGAAQIKRLLPRSVGIFILPPSATVLEERLRKRGTDSTEVIARRLAGARAEIAHVFEFEYIIINDRFDDAALDMISVVHAARSSAAAQRPRVESILAGFTSA